MSEEVRRRGSRSQQRIVGVSPISRAVQSALAASAAVLGLVGSGVAHADDCVAGAASVDRGCAGDRTLDAAARAPVVDLTRVSGAPAPASVVEQRQARGGRADADDIGIYIVSDGHVGLTNRLDVEAASETGLADAIFIGAGSIDLNNRGTLSARGFTWGAGIEAQAEADNTIVNSGAIDVIASANEEAQGGPYGHAYGIYAASSAGDLTIDNRNGGDISARGPYATGLHAYNGGGGAIRIDNAANITATSKRRDPADPGQADYGGFTNAIRAAANVEGSRIDVINTGKLHSEGTFNAKGIDVQATGGGNEARVVNNGGILAIADTGYDGGGITVASDGGSLVINNGSIQVDAGYAYGAQVLAGGDAALINGGEIQARNTGPGFFGISRGLDAGSVNGHAHILNDSSGTVRVGGGARAAGIIADGATASAVNEGRITIGAAIDGSPAGDAVAVQALSHGGNALATNSGVIEAGGSVASGVDAAAASGDVRAANLGSITLHDSINGYGVKAVTLDGDVVANNTSAGDIHVDAGGLAVGLVGWSRQGNAAARNTGDVVSNGLAGENDEGEQVGAELSVGLFGRADAGNLRVTNSGFLQADNAFGDAAGIRADASGHVAVTNTDSGRIIVSATGPVDAEGNAPLALGIGANSTGGSVAVRNAGAIRAASSHGQADGIFVGQDRVNVHNSGSIDVNGTRWAAGIEAQGLAWTAVRHEGDIAATSLGNSTETGYGHAYGIYATGGEGGVRVNTSEDSLITAIGPYVTGIHASNGYGGLIAVHHRGDLQATDTTADGEVLQGFAAGIRAKARMDGSRVLVTNSGNISSQGYFASIGIDVVAQGDDNDVRIDNSGDILASITSRGGYAANGIYGSADGDLSITNSGKIELDKAGFGIRGAAIDGTVVATNSGAITVAGGGSGIAVTAGEDAVVSNSGMIAVGGNKYNYVVQVAATHGDARIINDGLIRAGSDPGDKYVFGVITHAEQEGTAQVVNNGDIIVSGRITNAAQAITGTGNATFVNASSADIGVTGALFATGAYAARNDEGTQAGEVTMRNDGRINVVGTGGTNEEGEAFGAFVATGMFAYSAGATANQVVNAGDVIVTNAFGRIYGLRSISAQGGRLINTSDGEIRVSATGPGDSTISLEPNALGIEAWATTGGLLSVENAGSIQAHSAHGRAAGIMATGHEVVVRNDGDIAAAASTRNDSTSPQGHAYGIHVTGSGSHVDVQAGKGGVIAATGNEAIGIHAVDGKGGSIAIAHAGELEANDGFEISPPWNGHAIGINAITEAEGSQVLVSNSGNIASDAWSGSAIGIHVQALGKGNDARIDNLGTVSVSAHVHFPTSAIQAKADGNLWATNSGKLFAVNRSRGSVAYGLDLTAGNDVDLYNSGAISLGRDGTSQIGAHVTALNGNAKVRNAGAINVGDARLRDVVGAWVVANRGHASFENIVGGSLNIGHNHWSGHGAGSIALGEGAIASFVNAGKINLEWGVNASGATVRAEKGEAVADNRGIIAVAGSIADGLTAIADRRATISNTGRIEVDGNYNVGIFANAAKITLGNSGDILVDSRQQAIGVSAKGDDIAFSNSGDILVNSKSDKVTDAVGVELVGDKAVRFDNSGRIIAKTNDGDGVAVWIKTGGALRFRNTGVLQGQVITEAGDNVFTNDAGSTWTLDRQSTDFAGSGNQVHNLAGSVIALDDGRIGMGSGLNLFRNDGAIQVLGDSTIDMSTSGQREGAVSVAGERFADLVLGHGHLPNRRGLPLINDGVIDLSAARAGGNRLRVDGDLAGHGRIVLDGQAGGRADALQVTGNVRTGTRQQVDVALRGLPEGPQGSAGKLFAQVDGAAEAGAFVAGRVVGQEAGNFVDLGVEVSEAAVEQGQAYQAQVQALGLNATGRLAASLGAGVQNLLTSQIGTYRQRAGVLPSSTVERVGGYVRQFGGGGARQGELIQNFGVGGPVDLHQSTQGTELALAAAPVSGWTLGLTLGKSDSRQSLAAGSYGLTRFDADSMGAFATWMAPSGWYVDGSAWMLRYTGRLDSAAGRQGIHGRASALNLETGYTLRLGGGVHLEPQLQYTTTRVSGMYLQGPDAGFATQASQWERSRFGVQGWKTFAGAGGREWTPYGSVSGVYSSGTGVRYRIEENYLGTFDLLGRSVQAEAGFGMRQGRFSASASLNWTRGEHEGAQTGGQLTMRYTW